MPPALLGWYFFLHFFSVATFSHRRSAQIKKLILRKLFGAAILLKTSDLVFLFGGSKLALLALRAVRHCRQLASAPGAARLVFVKNFLAQAVALQFDFVQTVDCQ